MNKNNYSKSLNLSVLSRTDLVELVECGERLGPAEQRLLVGRAAFECFAGRVLGLPTPAQRQVAVREVGVDGHRLKVVSSFEFRCSGSCQKCSSDFE